jgi:hypothetical protein
MQYGIVYRNRQNGKMSLWNPGCDHAGIATQVCVIFLGLFKIHTCRGYWPSMRQGDSWILVEFLFLCIWSSSVHRNSKKYRIRPISLYPDWTSSLKKIFIIINGSKQFFDVEEIGLERRPWLQDSDYTENQSDCCNFILTCLQ